MKTAFSPDWRTPRELVIDLLLHKEALDHPEREPVFLIPEAGWTLENMRAYHERRVQVLRGLVLGGPDGDFWEVTQ